MAGQPDKSAAIDLQQERDPNYQAARDIQNAAYNGILPRNGINPSSMESIRNMIPELWKAAGDDEELKAALYEIGLMTEDPVEWQSMDRPPLPEDEKQLEEQTRAKFDKWLADSTGEDIDGPLLASMSPFGMALGAAAALGSRLQPHPIENIRNEDGIAAFRRIQPKNGSYEVPFKEWVDDIRATDASKLELDMYLKNGQGVPLSKFLKNFRANFPEMSGAGPSAQQLAGPGSPSSMPDVEDASKAFNMDMENGGIAGDGTRIVRPAGRATTAPTRENLGTGQVGQFAREVIDGPVGPTGDPIEMPPASDVEDFVTVKPAPNRVAAPPKAQVNLRDALIAQMEQQAAKPADLVSLPSENPKDIPVGMALDDLSESGGGTGSYSGGPTRSYSDGGGGGSNGGPPDDPSSESAPSRSSSSSSSRSGSSSSTPVAEPSPPRNVQRSWVESGSPGSAERSGSGWDTLDDPDGLERLGKNGAVDVTPPHIAARRAAAQAPAEVPKPTAPSSQPSWASAWERQAEIEAAEAAAAARAPKVRALKLGGAAGAAVTLAPVLGYLIGKHLKDADPSVIERLQWVKKRMEERADPAADASYISEQDSDNVGETQSAPKPSNPKPKPQPKAADPKLQSVKPDRSVTKMSGTELEAKTAGIFSEGDMAGTKDLSLRDSIKAFYDRGLEKTKKKLKDNYTAKTAGIFSEEEEE